MIYEFVMGGIFTSAFIPIFMPYLENDEKKKEGWRVINTLFSAIVIWLGLISLICSLCSPFLIYIQTLLAKSHEDRALAIYFFRFFAFQILLYGVSSYCSGVLNAFHKFAVTAAAPIVNNFIVIATLILFMRFPKMGSEGLVIGTMLGVFAMVVIQMPQIIRLGWKPQFSFTLKDPVLNSIIKLGIPVALYVAINQVGFLVRTNLAYPYVGGFSALQIGFTFFNLPYGIFAVAVTTVIFPTLSKMALKEDLSDFRQISSKGFRWISLALFPSAAMLLILSKPIVILLMEYGKFTGRDVDFLSRVIASYALGIIPFGFFMFLTRVFYSFKDTKTPTIINSIGVAINIVSNIIMVKIMGVEGIALNTGITYFIMCLIGFEKLSKRAGQYDRKAFTIPVIITSLVTAIMGIAIYITCGLTSFHGTKHIAAALNLAFPLMVGLAIYSALIFLIHFLYKKRKIEFTVF